MTTGDPSPRAPWLQRLVDVGVRVWLSSIPFEAMLMLMVFIMGVRVLVRHAVVVMQVFVVLRQMQPDPGAHQQSGRHQRGGQWRSENNREYRADERRQGEICACSCGAKATKCND